MGYNNEDAADHRPHRPLKTNYTTAKGCAQGIFENRLNLDFLLPVNENVQYFCAINHITNPVNNK